MSFTTMGHPEGWVAAHLVTNGVNQPVAHPLRYRAIILLAMYFTPHNNRSQACWHCTHFLALIYQDTAAKCALPPGIGAMPERGCAFWEREVGADDEAGPPLSAGVPRRLVATDQPVAVAWAP